MKITLEVKDSRFSQFMEMVRKLDFVKVLDESGSTVEEPPMTHYASEKTLAKDWLTEEEDQAWKDL